MRIAASVSAMLPALLLFAGCQLEPSRDGADAPIAPADPGHMEWEPLPQGKSYLFKGFDSSGTPAYTPVTFADSQALIEGDIVIAAGAAALEKLRAQLVDPSVEPAAPLAKTAGFVKTSTVTGGANAWPNGLVPYIVAGGGDQAFKANIDAAVYEFNQGGGVSFVPWDGVAMPVAVFVKVTGISSSQVGMVSPTSSQIISINGGATRPAILHEMGHAAGLYHEHTRPDRDNSVTITTSGVDDSGWFATNWAILNDGTTVGAYDLKSIMHYGTGIKTYKRANGQNYTVTMTAKNGQSGGGAVFTATDKQALWSIPVSANPLRPKALMSGMTGKVTKLFNTLSAGVTRKWICVYDPATGNANITAINADNSVGSSVQNVNVGTGFDIITPYLTLNSSPCILFYRTATGSVKLHNLVPSTGNIGSLILSATWSPGWTLIEHYFSENKSFLLFRNAGTSAVAIYSLGSTGNLSGLTFSGTSDWIYAKPFYSEASLGGLTAYCVFRGSDNLTRIRRMPGTGVIGNIVAETFVPGTSLGLWQSGTKAYLATMHGGSVVMVYDIDHTGFRTIGGTPIYRAYNLGSTLRRIDAAVDYNAVAFEVVDNKIYNFQHVLAYEYTNLPANRFIGVGAPFR